MEFTLQELKLIYVSLTNEKLEELKYYPTSDKIKSLEQLQDKVANELYKLKED